MSSKSSLSSSGSSSSSIEFEVFLSFRGEDTRKGFAGHLHEALYQRGIKTFIDEESLERGKNIKERIFSAIERSAVCIPILSPSYADSRWCLMELAKMIEFGKKIIPIFYHVDPSDVRHQRGTFEAAFQSYQLRFDRSTVMEWRKALREAADISGYDLRNVANGNEAALIRLIVDKVSQELIYGPYNLAGMSGSSPGYMAIENQMKRQQEQWLMKFADDMKQMPVLGTPTQQYSPGMQALEKVAEQQHEQYLMQLAEELNSKPLFGVQTRKTPGIEALEKVVEQQSEQFLLQFAEEMKGSYFVGDEPHQSPAMEAADDQWKQQQQIYRKQFDQLIKQQQEQLMAQIGRQMRPNPDIRTQTNTSQEETWQTTGNQLNRLEEEYLQQFDQLIREQQERYLLQLDGMMKDSPNTKRPM